MKRGGPLERRTPLTGGKPLARVKRLTARTRPVGRTEFKNKPATPSGRRPPSSASRGRYTGPTPEVIALVEARDGGLCVRCNQPAGDKDHRQGRGMGGTKGAESDRINGAAWLLTLCGSGNTSGCHGWKETNRVEAVALGYRIERNAAARDAEQVPVFTYRGWALFSNDGTRHPFNLLEGTK